MELKRLLEASQADVEKLESDAQVRTPPYKPAQGSSNFSNQGRPWFCLLTDRQCLPQESHKDWCQAQSMLGKMQEKHEQQLLETEEQLKSSELDRQGSCCPLALGLTARIVWLTAARLPYAMITPATTNQPGLLQSCQRQAQQRAGAAASCSGATGCRTPKIQECSRCVLWFSE